MKTGINRIALVTGAYGAIGKAIAGQLAANAYATTLVGRDENRLSAAVDGIIRHLVSRITPPPPQSRSRSPR